MNFKKIIKLFIPPIIIKLKYKLSMCMKRKGFFLSTINEIEKNCDKFIVIGNGPSLNKTWKKYKDKMYSCDCICVNSFCETKYYKELKPKYYLFADPDYFGDVENYDDWMKERIKKVITSIVDNTSWDLNLIVPSYAFNSGFVKQCTGSKFIHLYYYNNRDARHCDESKKFQLWDKNLLSVPAQTCLNTCLWLGIFLRYKEIYLVGADTN